MAPSQNIMMNLNLLRTTNFCFWLSQGLLSCSLSLYFTVDTFLLTGCHLAALISCTSSGMHFPRATILLWVALGLSLFSHFPPCTGNISSLPALFFVSHGAPTLWFIHDLAPFEAGRFQSPLSSGEEPCTNLAGWGPGAPTSQSKGGHRVAQVSVSKSCLIANLGFSMVFKV